MKNDTLILDASKDGELLKIRIHKENDAISQYEIFSVHIREIEEECRKMTELLNKAGIKGGQSRRVADKLREMGRRLANDLLTGDMRGKLGNSLRGDCLILGLDDTLVHIPWELICVGQDEFLCERFEVGRMVRTRQDISILESRKIACPTKMWIVADPRNDLDSAAEEGDLICEYMDGIGEPPLVHADLDFDNIAPEGIRGKLKKYDFVHFAGHADFDPHEPGQSGWRVSDGSFEADDVYDMRGGEPMPALVFSNACQSARTEEWIYREGMNGRSFGLPNAFMLAGVQHYIGTSWDIMDKPGGYFAQRFYRYLLSGETVGQAVRQARLDLIKGGDEVCWASYLLYGDPRERYFSDQVNVAEDEKPLEKAVVTREDKKAEEKKRTSDGISIKQPPILTPTPGEYEGEDRKDKKKLNKWIWLPVNLALILAIIMIIYPLIFPETSESDKWTSELLTLAVAFDSRENPFDMREEDRITAAIQSGLRDFTRIKLVERDPLIFKWIEDEILMWEKKYMDSRLQPKVLPARFFLHFKMDKTTSPPLVSMRLLDTVRGSIKEVMKEELENTASIFEQKKKLSEKLITYFKAHYPLRGRIMDVKDGEILLNIGMDAGTEIGQQFQVVDEDIILEVESVKQNSSHASVKKGDMPQKQGKIEWMN